MLLMIALMMTPTARAQGACKWNEDCLSWTWSGLYTDGSAVPVSNFANYTIETAKAASGPWAVLAVITNQATKSYVRTGVSGTNYYRVTVKTTGGAVSVPSAVGQSVTVEPLPEPVELLIVDSVGYQINLGSNNRIYFSRVGTVPIGRECNEGMTAMGKHVIRSRDWLVLDAGKTRPRQVFATCEVG